MELDVATIGAGMSAPGMDPRQWVSYGTVAEATPDQPSVVFKDADGNPLPAPLVWVKLAPSGIPVLCRVASFIAGGGEGSWYPFSPRDEVLVALPQGSEAAGPIIVARLNQEIDAWPSAVAGQDMTKNVCGFWRLRVPFIVETAESFLIRSAKTGSQLGIDSQGQVILNNGDRNHLFIGSDAISLSDGDDVTFLQLNFTEKRITAATGDARLELAASGGSSISVPGTLNLGTSGTQGKNHAVSIEQVVGLLMNYTVWLSTMGGVSSLATSVLATPEVFGAMFGTMLLNMGVTMAAVPPPSGVPVAVQFGNYALFPTVFGPAGAISLSLLNPIPVLDPTGFIPGVGVPGLLI